MVLRSVTLPAYNRHTHTVIFLHGRGSNAREFSEELWESRDGRGESLQHIFPSVKWIFPQTVESYTERLEDEPSKWFNMSTLSDPDANRETQIPGLQDAVPQLISLIQNEAAGVGLENIVLAGISQGCATAVHALLNYPSSGTEVDEHQRLCGFVGVSSWMSLGADSVEGSRRLLQLEPDAEHAADDQVVRNTPVFLSHCADDPVVSIEQGKRLKDTLETYGMSVTWHEYPTGGHWLNEPQGVEDIVKFLKSQGL
ncbi:phospholipase/carboxylesterase family protein [Xylariaceae sp. FL0594]|nr:phospholipase/carboxylesterase family protein [Xylariaceae sp. FL0594]